MNALHEVNAICVIYLSTASPLQPEISNIDCTEKNAIVEWINCYHDDRNTIWGYCVHHCCTTVNDVVTGEIVRFSLLLYSC